MNRMIHLSERSLPICLLALLLSGCQGPQASPAVQPSRQESMVPAGATPAPSSTPATGSALNTPAQTSSAALTPTTSSSMPPQPLSPGQAITLTSLHMMSESVGWAIESLGHIVRTLDGGTTWQDVTPVEEVFEEQDFYALDANTAWAGQVVQGTGGPAAVIWRTDNGGRSWQSSRSPTPFFSYSPNHPRSLYFINPETGWFIWDNYVNFYTIKSAMVKATRNGEALDLISSPVDEAWRISGIVFTDGQVGFLGIRLGIDPNAYKDFPTLDDFVQGRTAPVILKTMDGGRNWNSLELPPLNPIPVEIQSGTSQGSASYQMECGETKVQRISDHGIGIEVTCTLLKTGKDYIYYYLSPDGGENWQSWLSTGNEYFLSPDLGWRLYTEPTTLAHRLQQTTDRGKTWNDIKSVAWEGARFNFVSERDGWAIATRGEEWALIHTADGGKLWSEIRPRMDLITSPLELSGNDLDFHMTDTNEGWASTSTSSQIDHYYHLANMGRTWQEVTPKDGLSDCGSFFLNDQTAWLARCGKIKSTFRLLRTTDGGKNWETMNTAVAGEADIHFSSLLDGWLRHYGFGAGSGDLRFDRTNDGGSTWSRIQLIKQPDSTPVQEGAGLYICYICGGTVYFDGFRLILATGTAVWGPGVPFTLDITADYGQSWHHVEISRPFENDAEYYYIPDALAFFSQTEGIMSVIVRTDASFRGRAFYTTRDGGYYWKLSYVEPEARYFDNYNYLSLTEAIASFHHLIFASQDGMATWTEIHPNLDFPALSADGSYRMQFVDLRTGWITFYDRQDTPMIYSTTDGGWSWSKIDPGLVNP